METANLKIVYSHKNKYENTLINQNRRTQFINRFEIQVRSWYKKLEQLGIAAGTAIRN
ncbi:hypothetical protein [Aquimarina algiphila]|uniref:hypothetical protein n=1 Tax=Aquimarina algiphila TaxID=2047982 RepID=UPI00232BD26B|nr:hypothetical protein [Aquimarina algiphila]